MQSSIGKRPNAAEIDRVAVRIVHALHRRASWTDEVITAIDLADEIDCAPKGSHETRRRRVRAGVHRAREMLRAEGASEVLVATGLGYALSCDPALINQWLERRRREGLTDLVEVGKTQRSKAVRRIGGQRELF